MAHFDSLSIGLSFVLVIDSVESAVEIILIMAPGNACHNVDSIAVLPPALNALGQAWINPINYSHIRAKVRRWTPRLTSLEAGAFKRLLRLGRKCQRWVCCMRTRAKTKCRDEDVPKTEDETHK